MSPPVALSPPFTYLFTTYKLSHNFCPPQNHSPNIRWCLPCNRLSPKPTHTVLNWRALWIYHVRNSLNLPTWHPIGGTYLRSTIWTKWLSQWRSLNLPPDIPSYRPPSGYPSSFTSTSSSEIISEEPTLVTDYAPSVSPKAEPSSLLETSPSDPP